MENNRNFENCITLDKKTLITSNFGIHLCLGCSFDQYQKFRPALDSICIPLFFCLKTIENNRNTMKTIEIVKKILIDVIPL